MFVLFIGIVGWTYSSKRKQSFDEAARLDDDEDVVGRPGSAGPKHN
jgi:cbb3-type cytochrome oxidase subunit 3